jgi:hypothetical protein
MLARQFRKKSLDFDIQKSTHPVHAALTILKLGLLLPAFLRLSGFAFRPQISLVGYD